MNHLTVEQFWALIENKLSSTDRMSAMEHIHDCEECSLQFRVTKQLEKDLHGLTNVEVPSGFALKVTARVKEKEVNKIFYHLPFKVFRSTLISSLAIIFIALIIYSLDETVQWPQWEITSGKYIMPSILCFLLVYTVEKVFLKKRLFRF